MEKRTTQAMSTRNRKRTIVTPPSCPRRFNTTNIVAMNQPQPHDMSMYSRCSVHWTHIRTPSSKKVETRQKRAKWGRTCFVCRVIWKSKRRKWNVTPLLHDFGGQQYIVEHCGSPSPTSFCLSFSILHPIWFSLPVWLDVWQLQAQPRAINNFLIC